MLNISSFTSTFFLSATSAVIGNLLLKSGMNRLGNFDISLQTLLPTILKFAANWQIVVGFILYGASSFLYLKLLSMSEVTKVYPALVAYMFIVLLIFGSLFLKESLSVGKVVGIGIIIAGILLASR